MGHERRTILRLRWAAAGLGALTLVLLSLTVGFSIASDDCLADAGYTGDDPWEPGAPDQCRNVSDVSGLFSFLLVLYALAGLITGIVLGLLSGRRRRDFSHGSVGAMVGFGFGMFWGFLGHSIGYGIGRALPPSASSVAEAAYQRHEGDVARYTHDLVRHLLAGGTPQQLAVPELAMTEPVLLDAPMQVSMFSVTTTDYVTTALTSVGSPLFVNGVDVAATYGSKAAGRPAEPMHAAVWMPLGLARVLVTPTATWCLVNGTWSTLQHAAVICDVFSDAVVLNGAPAQVVLLRGPFAQALAALHTWLRGGRAGLAEHPLFRAAQPTLPAWGQYPHD